MSLAVDTLQLAKSLAEAGMDRAQAEVLSSALARGLRDGDLATKSDLEALRKDLKADIESGKKDQKIESATIRTEIVASRNQMILAMIAIVGLALAISRFLH